MTSRIDSKRFADGQAVAKADLRDAFDAAREELAHGGYAQPAGPDLPPRRVQDRLGEMLSVKDFGAVGDGSTDDSAAFQAAIDNSVPVFVPSGTYNIGTSLIYGPGHGQIHFYGVGDPENTTLQYSPGADTDVPMIHNSVAYLDKDGVYRDPTDGSVAAKPSEAGPPVYLENLRFNARNAGKHANAVDIILSKGGYVANCAFVSVARCLTFGTNTFDGTVTKCEFDCWDWHNHYDGSNADDMDRLDKLMWGLYVTNHEFLSDINTQGTAASIRICGGGSSLINTRCESVYYAVRVGSPQYSWGTESEPTKTRLFAFSGHLLNLRFEACGVALDVRNARGALISGLQSQGSPASGPTGRWFDSQICVRVGEKVERSTKIENVYAFGLARQAHLVNYSNVPVVNCRVASSQGERTPLLPDDTGNEPKYHFLETPFSEDPAGGFHPMTAFSSLVHRGLTGLNLFSRNADGNIVFAKKLGGVAEPDSGANSVDVTFFGGTNVGLAATLSINVVADDASTLPAGTYVYSTVMIEPHAEMALDDRQQPEVTVAGGERVELTYGTRDWMRRRRIYRGPTPDTFEGYWEIEGETPRPFIDDGNTPFDGVGAPPRGASIPSLEEDDANYQIVATPSWHTTVIVTNKATTGFTIEFGTPPPDDRQSVAWLLFRP